MTIASASIYPSSTYSDADLAFSTGDPGRSQLSVVPTGGGLGAKVYFDHHGAEVEIVNPAGTSRSLTLPAITSNPKNARIAFTIKWSDFVPVTSIPRSDGGTQHLLFVYVSISSANMVGSGFGVPAFNTGMYHRNRKHWMGQAWTIGRDYADNPAGTKFKNFTICPLLCIQYLTATSGVQILSTGDSLAAAPTTDWFSTPLWRAAADLSTRSLPIACASLAWGSTDYTVYDTDVRQHLAGIRPGIMASQVISRASMVGRAEAFQGMLLGQTGALFDAAYRAYQTAPLINIPGGEPSWDRIPDCTSAFLSMYKKLKGLALPVIDAPSVTAPASAPWDYLAGMSDDNTHLNSFGAEAVVPLARTALERLIG